MVVVEVRFPSASAGRPIPMPAQKTFRGILGDEWVIESMTMRSLEVQFGPQGPGSQRVQEAAFPRFITRDRTLAVALTDTTLTVETTTYRHYEEFRGVLARGLDATQRILEPDGVARIGMRYIDEVRIPGSPAEASSWAEWIDLASSPSTRPHAERRFRGEGMERIQPIRGWTRQEAGVAIWPSQRACRPHSRLAAATLRAARRSSLLTRF